MTTTTNVPAPTFSTTGFTAPLESEILDGVQADQQAAFGGDLNPALNTPQGQLAQSETAIIGDCYDQFMAIVNNVDPSYSSGRMQDAIGRIYFMTRITAAPTSVVCTCNGLAGTVIPVNAQAADQSGNVYLCSESGTIPIGGNIDLPFACAITGPIACPIGFVNTIYQAIPGWDTINNAGAGVVGNDVETRAAFESRRQQSVAANAQGSLPSVLGAVLAVPGVLDAYVTENVTNAVSGVTFTGAIAGTTLTVSGPIVGTVALGHTITGAGIAQGTYITAFGTGVGGAGTYILNISQTVSSEAMVGSFGGVQLVANSLYVAVVGGTAADVAQAIWSKKSPGCNYNGSTTVTVTDVLPGFLPPYPTYQVSFQIPTSTPVLFAVSMQNNPNVPANAVDLVRNAVTASFLGADGGSRARIGSVLFASRFYANIAALGSWALVYAIKLGVGAATRDSVLMNINQVPTLALTDIAVTFS